MSKQKVLLILSALMLITSCAQVRFHPANISREQAQKIVELENPHRHEVEEILKSKKVPLYYGSQDEKGGGKVHYTAYPVDYKSGSMFYCQNLGVAVDSKGWVLAVRYIDQKGAQARCNGYAAQSRQLSISNSNSWRSIAQGMNSFNQPLPQKKKVKCKTQYYSYLKSSETVCE